MSAKKQRYTLEELGISDCEFELAIIGSMYGMHEAFACIHPKDLVKIFNVSNPNVQLVGTVFLEYKNEIFKALGSLDG
jgi:hypothetical protein